MAGRSKKPTRSKARAKPKGRTAASTTKLTSIKRRTPAKRAKAKRGRRSG